MINGAGFNPYYGQQQAGYMPQFPQGNYSGSQFQGAQFQGPPMPPPFMPGLMPGMMPGMPQGGFNGFQNYGQQQGPGFGGRQGFFGGPNGGQMREQIDSVFSQFNLNAKEVFSQVKDALGGKRPSSPEEMQNALTQVLQNDGLSSEDIQSLESQLPPPPPPRMGHRHQVNNQADATGTGQTNCKQTTNSTDDSSTTTSSSSTSTDLSTLETELSTLLSALGGGASSTGATDASTLLSELSTLMASYTGSATS